MSCLHAGVDEVVAACMQVDIQEKDTEIIIKADTPGLTGADISVCIDTS